MVLKAIIPARFLSLTAHFVLNVMVYWSRRGNVEACIPFNAGIDSSQYTTKDIQLLVAISLTLVFTIVEFISFVSGLSLFTSLPNMYSATSHAAATICLALFTVNNWSCDSYWYIFGFCSVPSLLLEILVIIAAFKFKIFN